MYTDYIFYLRTLMQAERNKQILTIILIWSTMLVIAGVIEFIKYKIKNEF